MVGLQKRIVSRHDCNRNNRAGGQVAATSRYRIELAGSWTWLWLQKLPLGYGLALHTRAGSLVDSMVREGRREPDAALHRRVESQFEARRVWMREERRVTV